MPLPYQNLMVAIDNSECSGYAMDLGIDLAKTTGARLTGNHVYPARLHDTRFKQLEPGLPQRYQHPDILLYERTLHDGLIGRGLQIISDSYLDAFAEKCQQAGVTPDRRTPEGKHYEKLVEDSRQSGYDLVVIGAHGLGRVKRSVLGSVCERVLRLGCCDTLVARNGSALKNGRLVVAIDGSSNSFEALTKALTLAGTFGMPVTAVAAYDPFFHVVAFRSIAGVLSDESAQLFRFREQERLHDEIIDSGLHKVYQDHLLRAQEIGRENGIEMEIQVLLGKPYDAISDYLAETNPALLVIGHSGLHEARGTTVGATAENLVRFACCNVLVVRSGRNEESEPSPTADNEPVPTEPASRRPHLFSMMKRSKSAPGPDDTKPVTWSEEAEQRLEHVPSFARLMARKGIERFAAENGYSVITPDVYEAARKRFGM